MCLLDRITYIDVKKALVVKSVNNVTEYTICSVLVLRSYSTYTSSNHYYLKNHMRVCPQLYSSSVRICDSGKKNLYKRRWTKLFLTRHLPKTLVMSLKDQDMCCISRHTETFWAVSDRTSCKVTCTRLIQKISTVSL